MIHLHPSPEPPLQRTCHSPASGPASPRVAHFLHGPAAVWKDSHPLSLPSLEGRQGTKGDSAPRRQRTRSRGTRCERPGPCVRPLAALGPSRKPRGPSVARLGAQRRDASAPKLSSPWPPNPQLSSLSAQPSRSLRPARPVKLRPGPSPGPHRPSPSILLGPATSTMSPGRGTHRRCGAA